VTYGSGDYGAGPYGISPPTLGSSVAPVALEDYTVLVTDRDLTVVGDPISVWTSLDITLRFNQPGSGILITPAYPWVREQIVPGNRIVVIRNGEVLMSGPIEERLHERSDDGEHAGDGRLTVHFADDLATVVARSVYPDPADTPPDQTIDNWTFTGNAELALRALVDLHAGPGALATRQVPQLVLGDLAGVGSSVAVNAQRQQPLGEVARQIAEVGGNLGFRTRQVGDEIEFVVYAPVDKSGTVRFSFGLGNLRYISHEMKAPTATSVSVGGQGEGADRAMIERNNATDETAWGRFEKHVARPGSGPLADLEDDGDRALADGAATTRVTTNVADTPDQRFGTHYSLGDIVAIEPWPGEEIIELVRVVHLQVYATTGEYVAAVIGNQAAVTDPLWVRRVREIDERLGRIERSVMPAAP
jgi:hypothetical protein